MPSSMHLVLADWSLAALHRPEHAFWKDVASQIPRLCVMPDQVSLDPKRWRPYVTLPGGHPLPHGPADSDHAGPPFNWRHDRRVARKILSHYMRRIIRTVTAGRVSRSAAFAGALAHYVHDCAGPAHVVNHYLLLRLLPKACRTAGHIHRPLDDVQVPQPPPFRPRLLGASVPEAVFHAEGMLQDVIEAALAALVPMVQCVGAGRDRALPKLLAPPYHAAAKLVASLWHTCFALAWNHMSKADLNRLDSVPLAARRPDDAFTLDPYPWEPLAGAALLENGDSANLTLRVRQAGRSRTRSFTDGLAMVHGHAFYRIPPGLYRRLRVRVGILARPPQTGAVTFHVVLGASPPTYEHATARVLRRGGRSVATLALDARDPSQELNVPLGSARGITLLTIASPLNTHVVWAQPTLSK